MTDIGDAVTVTTEIRVDDTLTDPLTVALDVTAPDGTTDSPTVTQPSTGAYEAVVEATQAGRWRYKWTATTPDAVDFGYFDVQGNPPPPGRPDALATISDLEDRLGRDLTDDEARRAEPLLRDASAQVRRYCRQDFDLTRGDVAVLRPVGADLVLPQRPVLAVSSVAAIPGDGQPDIVMSGWEWDGLDCVKIAGFGWRTAIDYDLEWDFVGWWASTYRVIYDHGYATTPDDVVGIVCGTVNRVLVAPSMVEGMLSERVGPFGYTLQQGSSGAPGPSVRLTQADRDALADAGYRRTADTIQLRT